MVKSNKGKRIVIKEDGTRVEGKAAPQLLPKHLRELPSDYVTTEHGDEDKAHPLDPMHVVRDIAKTRAFREASGGLEEREWVDQQNKEAAEQSEPMKKLAAAANRLRAGTSPRSPTQADADVLRIQVLMNMLNTAGIHARQGKQPNLDVCHVWFPNDTTLQYEMRPGNPPARSMRPKHLRNLELWVDPFNLPKTIVEILGETGKVDVLAMQIALQKCRRDYLTGKGDYAAANAQ
jgi:hypothetical protein